VTCRKEGELSIGQLRTCNVEQLKMLPTMKPERGLERLPGLEYSVTDDMRKRMIPEAF
jgi:hypothetical protein